MTHAVLAESAPSTSRQVAFAVYTVIAVWFGVVLAAALSGALESDTGRPPWPIVTALLLPLTLFGVVYATLEPVRAYVQRLDLRALVLLHTFRMLGVGFLLLSAFDILPLVFALPAGVGDALTAIAALALGIAMYSESGVHRRVVHGWNALGLIDFVAAVGLGVLSRSDGVLHLSGAVPSDAMGSFPLALIPAFIVPFYIITHLVVLIQLRTRWADVEWIHGRR